MKKGFLVVLVVLLGALAYAMFRPVSYKNFPPTATGDWIAFGDSLTSGYGAEPGKDYPSRLSQKLGLPIRNLGEVGDTTADGLKRLNEAVNLHPRVVLLCLGGNDGLQKLSPEEMVSNVDRMIGSFQQGGSFVVLIGVRSASLLDNNGSRFKKLAKQNGAFYVPNILDGVLGSPSLMSDQIHPNEAGYEAIADRLATLLNPLLPQLKSR
jgi:acyl-CoA thioesterase-1